MQLSVYGGEKDWRKHLQYTKLDMTILLCGPLKQHSKFRDWEEFEPWNQDTRAVVLSQLRAWY